MFTRFRGNTRQINIFYAKVFEEFFNYILSIEKFHLVNKTRAELRIQEMFFRSGYKQ